MKTIRSLRVPPTPDLAGDYDFDAIAAYVACTYGVPKGTVALFMMATLTALTSRALRYSLHGTTRTPSMQIILLEGHTDYYMSWHRFLLSPIAELLKEQSLSESKLAENIRQLENCRSRIEMANGNSELRIDAIIRGRRIWDETRQARLLMGVPGSDDFAYDFSPLLVGSTRDLVRSLNSTTNGCMWAPLLCGFKGEFSLTSPFTILCAANRSDLKEFEQGPMGKSLFPLVLPQRGGEMRATTANRDEILKSWVSILRWAARTWTVEHPTFVVDTYGAETLTRLKTLTDSLGDAALFPQRYSWVLSMGVTIACVEQSRRFDSPVIDTRAWNVAERFVRWAIEAHAACLVYTSRRCFHPASVHDRKRLETRIKANPTWTFRLLHKALPKRPKGYWRLLYKRFEKPDPSKTQGQENTDHSPWDDVNGRPAGSADPASPAHPASNQAAGGVR